MSSVLNKRRNQKSRGGETKREEESRDLGGLLLTIQQWGCFHFSTNRVCIHFKLVFKFIICVKELLSACYQLSMVVGFMNMVVALHVLLLQALLGSGTTSLGDWISYLEQEN
ncbi:hypothetical protein POM88_027496 [Heracleum sosnowskyi]|uniref:Uncharacterized protein n=1 Tax=Heracleum sosnowskyi TaxID=360622 RepID=A0AAD8I7Q6_9APIA|nr:hypothetical protein POM88_027496 [Heracleum sosnowskyi]